MPPFAPQTRISHLLVALPANLVQLCGREFHALPAQPKRSHTSKGAILGLSVAQQLLHQAVTDAETRDKLSVQGVTPNHLTADEFRATVASEIERWRPVSFAFITAGLRLREVDMLGFSRWQIFKTSTAAVLTVGTISLLLIYFIPAPPSTVTMGTGGKGTTFEYFGQRYRDIFARSHIELKLRETGGAVDNLELLKNQTLEFRLPSFSEASPTGSPRRECCRWEPCTLTHFGSFIPRMSRWTDCHSSKASASLSALSEAAPTFQRNDFLAGAASIPRRPRCFLSQEQRQPRHSMKAK